MKIVCPECGSAALWLLDDWVDVTLADAGVSINSAGVVCECRICRTIFEVRATGFEVKITS